MCGLFGAVIQVPLNTELRGRLHESLQLMAVMSSERGKDSAGIARVGLGERVMLYKDVGSSERLTRRKPWKMVTLKAPEDTYAFIGHTRRRTSGKITPKNAHPFLVRRSFGRLIGAHNGSISNHRQFGPTKPYDNDSHNLLYTLADTEDWGDVLRNVIGTYAIVAARNGQVWMTRNSIQSPLSVIHDPRSGVTLYASEPTIVSAGQAIGGFGTPLPQLVPTSTLWKFSSRELGAVEYMNLPGTEAWGTAYSYAKSTELDDVGGKMKLRGYHRAVCSRCRDVHDRKDMITYGGRTLYCQKCIDHLWESYYD